MVQGKGLGGEASGEARIADAQTSALGKKGRNRQLAGGVSEAVQAGQASRRRQHGSPGAMGGARRAHAAGGPGSPLGAGSGPEDTAPESLEGSLALQGSQPLCQWPAPGTWHTRCLLGGALGLGSPEADPETRVPCKQLVWGVIPVGKWGLR